MFVIFDVTLKSSGIRHPFFLPRTADTLVESLAYSYARSYIARHENTALSAALNPFYSQLISWNILAQRCLPVSSDREQQNRTLLSGWRKRFLHFGMLVGFFVFRPSSMKSGLPYGVMYVSVVVVDPPSPPPGLALHCHVMVSCDYLTWRGGTRPLRWPSVFVCLLLFVACLLFPMLVLVRGCFFFLVQKRTYQFLFYFIYLFIFLLIF